VTSPRLAGTFSVEASATRIRHYRYVEERMTRLLGGWIALTPELSAKLLLGRHVWDCAQHADLWGKRLPELRAPAQQSEPPGEAFVRFMDLLEGPEGFHETPERLTGIYRVLKPALLAAYEAHLAAANPVYEPPTRRILQRCIEEERRHIAAGAAILRHVAARPEVMARAVAWGSRLQEEFARTAGIGGDGVHALAPLPSADDVPEVAQDLVQLEKPVGRFPLPDELARAVDANGQALRAGDLGALERQVEPQARAAVVPTYREALRLPVSDVTVVASARLGNQWQIRQRLTGGAAVRVLQARWLAGESGWQVAQAEIVRREPVPSSVSG
jgi:hypothetical protein